MGFLDDLSSTLNRGAEVTARTGRSIKLKAQIADQKSQRNNACMRLGAAVYERAKEDPALYEGLTDMITSIADIDDAIAAFQVELDKIEAEAAASTRAYWVGVCPNCGYRMTQGDAFCSRCGTKMPAPGDPVDADASAKADDAQEDAIIDVEPIAEAEVCEVAEQTQACPECGKEIEGGAAFCGDCGAKAAVQDADPAE